MAFSLRFLAIFVAACAIVYGQDSGNIDPFGEKKADVKVQKKVPSKKTVKKVSRNAESRGVKAPVLQFEDTLVQYAPFWAFSNKFYSGDMDLRTLSLYGDFGFGAFNSLEAFMVANEGKFYEISPNGEMKEINSADMSKFHLPFALITTFRGSISVPLPLGVDKKYLEKKLSENLPSMNYPVAVRITGKFAKVSTCLVSATSATKEPLNKLYEKYLCRKEFVDIFGTIVGFYIPKTMRSSMQDGWHFYFINEYADGGGQLVDFESGKLSARADILSRYYLIMPKNKEFKDMDTSRISSVKVNIPKKQ